MDVRSAKCLALALCVAATPAFAMHSHHHTLASHHSARHTGRHHTVAVVQRWHPGQREIDPDRTREIQQALIQRNYLTGQPSGEWDDQTEAAMQKFQADNGWQTKLMPDSRALIKLGLGPNGAEGAVAESGTQGAIQPATGADTLASVHSIMN